MIANLLEIAMMVITLACVCVCVCLSALSCVQFFAIPWTVAYQIPLSMGFSRQGYWSGLPFPSPDPGIKPVSLASPVLDRQILLPLCHLTLA